MKTIDFSHLNMKTDQELDGIQGESRGTTLEAS